MKNFLTVLLASSISVSAAYATKIKGKVLDGQTGEAIAGATVFLEQRGLSTKTQLDGSFEFKGLSAGVDRVHIKHMAYAELIKEIEIQKENTPHFIFQLTSTEQTLMEVTIKGRRNGGDDDPSARRLEKNASQIMNVVSARAIEISPDITVANVVQRVSGVSIERNSNGEGQYAILRGMDKRYNTTLVNGVKVPSPDNKYRYVPLDLFPSDMLERLEVYKSLTPNMEADAVGGVVNMVMKSAPTKLLLQANLATGYSQRYFNRDFGSFSTGGTSAKSPYELNGKNYNATAADFNKGALDYTYKKPLPDLVGNLTIGNRYLDDKLGVILGASYQNLHRGSRSIFYKSAVVGVNPNAVITEQSDRQYDEQQQRLGLHNKIDYRFNPNHRISFYQMYVNLNNMQLRDAVNTIYNGQYDPSIGKAELTYVTRSRKTQQQIYNGTLQGDHHFLDNRLNVRWSGVLSSARNQLPQNTMISLDGVEENFERKRTSLVNKSPVTYRWERNTDNDRAGYWDVAYKVPMENSKLELSTGGLYRDKQRSSFYNNYNLSPASAEEAKYKYGVDFQRYTDLNLTVTNPTGAVANPLTYDAGEKTTALYGMFNYENDKWQMIGGIRMEHTNQNYKLLFPAGEKRPEGSQIYTEWLPSLTMKYHLDEKQQLHAAYYRALNRPGFYEIVPSSVINEEFLEKGNPDLKHALADNFDLRYELFPEASSQFLVGMFYKKIKNPIEYTFQPDEVRKQDVYYTPGNFGNANNFGLEVDYIKYIQKFGVKANYTYTHSRITTSKMSRRINETTQDPEAIIVDQTRPLYGQAAHIANLSLLYKDANNGWEGQLAGSYTGSRINTVSQFLNDDLWQKGFVQLDASIEKKFRAGWAIFAKANNILNTPMELYVKGTNPENEKIAEKLIEGGNTLIRKDLYGQNYILGLRYSFSK
ncbi:TonB-dependent receptor [Sphingobacterium paramultivorum]|uniref:TonB-dependent receptor n=1 Tax=Sphingobacterium paramultivorum TaxID=2886510 RepID=A0A7G5E0D2_9SPHI|nr:TonB-dependent receptor [Sphingobacterium paramultivorum]QMV67457.1 TonB-dependent receptor [Sphingobacterium paramultivorum]WSO16324.1 TonB-dependent receptor [Sphingobacterium paramultivorum]